jgi:sulfur relay (sulfurtransferase) complex TusBCD TusD component (DsrE family)
MFLLLMSNLHLLLILSNPRSLKHLIGITNAAKTRNHRISIFFNEESVKLLLDKRLEGLGDTLLACITSCQLVGITADDLINGAKLSSLGELVTLMEESDRTLFMG